jgi:hypothetical protein
LGPKRAVEIMLLALFSITQVEQAEAMQVNQFKVKASVAS